MFGNCTQVEKRRSGGQSEREKRAEGFPAHGRQDLRLTSRSSNRDASGTNGCLRKESLPYPQVMIILTLCPIAPRLAQSSHKCSIFRIIKVSRSRGRSTIRVVVRGLVSKLFVIRCQLPLRAGKREQPSRGVYDARPLKRSGDWCSRINAELRV